MSSDDDGKRGDGANDGYEIGYGKPPKDTQFRAGRSGNPKGRRKGVRNVMTDVKRTLKVPLKMTQSGRARTVSTQEAALMVLREKALSGDHRSLDRLIELAVRFNNEASDDGPAPALSASDQAILEAYTAEIRAAPKRARTSKSLQHQATDADVDPSSEPAE